PLVRLDPLVDEVLARAPKCLDIRQGESKTPVRLATPRARARVRTATDVAVPAHDPRDIAAPVIDSRGRLLFESSRPNETVGHREMRSVPITGWGIRDVLPPSI